MAKQDKPTEPKLEQDVTIDQDADTFDIDAWLDGATQPSRSVTVFQDAGARALFDDLEQQYRTLNARRTQQSSDGLREDTTLAEATDYDGQLLELADRMQEVVDRLERNPLKVTVRGATEDEHQGAADAAQAAGKNSATRFVYELLSRVATRPANLTPDQWLRVRDKVGMKQFDLIIDAMNDACGFSSGDGVMPDFSPSALAGRATMHS